MRIDRQSLWQVVGEIVLFQLFILVSWTSVFIRLVRTSVITHILILFFF